MPAEGYRRATAAGNDRLAEHYRQVIVEQYVARTDRVPMRHAPTRLRDSGINLSYSLPCRTCSAVVGGANVPRATSRSGSIPGKPGYQPG